MALWVEAIGGVAGICTTLCWIPQAAKILREKRTEGISLTTQSFFTFGVFLWGVYGLILDRWPIFLANGITLALSLAILRLKLRYR
jgi:MtN3 and saliva related transmembrane protein